MARYGQQLLRRLTFQYCDLQGASAGMRDYIASTLPGWVARNPTVIVRTVNKRNAFPLVKAEYGMLPPSAAHLQRHLAKQAEAAQQPKQQQQRKDPPLNSNVVGVKHRSAAEIREVVWWLSQSQCRSKQRRIPAKHIRSNQPSIQGGWAVTTF